MIDIHESENITIIDIPGTFLNTTHDEYVTILLRGKIVEMPVKVEPKLHGKHVTRSTNRYPLLYIKLNKILYE